MSEAPTIARFSPPRELLAKEKLLVAWLHDAGRVAIGYSGGVDSAYLAAVAVDALGTANALAVTGRSASYPEAQWEVARTLASALGIPLLELDTDELSDPRYAANPSNRCYFCKSELWERVVPAAAERGFLVVVDGTNADDLGDWRPGARAADERGVRSPLAEVALTKEDIRTLSRARGLPTWAQPSAPCLASLLPYGTAVTPERLRAVELAEARLRAEGVAGDLRVRHHGELARVELAPSVLARLFEPGEAQRLGDAVRAAGFERVAFDLAGFRSGSLNILDGVVRA